MPYVDEFYSVLIAYKSRDEESVEKIVNFLNREGIKPLYTKNIFAEGDWFSHFYDVIGQVRSVAIFFGSEELENWTENELTTLVTHNQGANNIPIIPILLPKMSSSDVPGIIKNSLHEDSWLKFPDQINSQNSIDILIDSFPSSVNGFDTLKTLIDQIKKAIQHQLEKYQYTIEINISDAKQSCFLSLPCQGAKFVFDAVKDVIQIIKTSQNYAIKLYQTKYEVDAYSFTHNRVIAIRESELIIADCAPDLSGNFSMEVGYDLGMARALGKPSIILSTDTEICKQMLKNENILMPKMTFIEYQSDNINTNSFKNKLEDDILDSIACLSHNLIDKSLQEIHVVRRADSIATWKNFSPELYIIMEFAFQLSDSCQNLIRTTHTVIKNINELSKDATSTIVNEKERFLIHFKNFYNTMKNEQEKWEQFFYSNDFQKFTNDVRKTYKFLKIHLHPNSVEHIEESWKWFIQLIDRDIAEYEKRKSTIKKFEDKNFECFNNFGLTYDFEFEVTMLDKTLRLIAIDTQNMITNILKGLPKALIGW